MKKKVVTNEGFRLWHQLTQKLFQFFEHPLARPYRVDVFERFVRDFEGKINQLKLVEMGVKVSKDIDSTFSPSFRPYKLLLTATPYRPPSPLNLPNLPSLTHRHSKVARSTRSSAGYHRAC